MGRPWALGHMLNLSWFVLLTRVSGGGHEHDGQTDGRRQDPVADVDDLGVARRPEVQRLHGVTHGHVAVDAHGGEGEDGREHVVVVDGHHHLAQDVSEGPGPHQVVDALERQSAGDHGVGQRQVEDVDVGGRLHLSVSAGRRRQRRRFMKKHEDGGGGGGGVEMKRLVRVL